MGKYDLTNAKPFKELTDTEKENIAYEQGYHDAVKKACAWLRKRTVFYSTRDKGFFLSAFVSAFRKEMEE